MGWMVYNKLNVMKQSCFFKVRVLVAAVLLVASCGKREEESQWQQHLRQAAELGTVQYTVQKVVSNNDESWKIFSRNPNLPAARVGTGAMLDECMVSEGCEVEGLVKHSLLFQGVRVGAGARVVDSVIMRGAQVDAGAVVERAVIAENVRVGEGARIGAAEGELCVLGPDACVLPGASVGAGESVEPNATVE